MIPPHPAAATVKQRTINTDEMSVTLLSWGAAIYDLRLSGVEYPLTLSGETIEAMKVNCCTTAR